MVEVKEKIYAQVLDRSSRDQTIKPVKGFSGVDQDITVYERYKITVLSQSDNADPTFAAWARLRTSNSGLGGQVSFDPIIAPNSFVVVEDDENGDWIITEVLSNVPPDLARKATELGLPASGFVPGSPVPSTYIKPDGNLTSERPHTPEESKEDEKQNLPNERAPENILTACKKVNVEGINSEIENLIKDVQNIKTELTGSDSFLATSQNFINEEILGRVNQASAKISEWTTWLIQEIRREVMRRINGYINDFTGNAPLSSRYLVTEAQDKTLSIISCLFIKILSGLENLIYQALSALIDKLVNTATCLIENFISNFIGQLVAQLTAAINAALRPISSLLGTVITFANEILDFAISILDFLTCKVENICPQVEKWNPLNGPQPPTVTLDFASIFNNAKGTVENFRGVLNIPDNIEDFIFDFDVQSALDATLNGCGVGPQSCGVPNVVFWGGFGSGASGNAVVNAVGDIIGVDIVSPGAYGRAPIINFEDNCGNGIGAVGIPVLGDVPIEPTTDPETGFPIDPETGFPIDPETGFPIDPETGLPTAPGAGVGTTTGVVGVVMANTGYGYLFSPNGSKGGMGRVWADRCQTIVRRVNGDWDVPYSEGSVIRLFYGDSITLPGKGEVIIDCDFSAIELPGCIETGEKYCYKDMRGFDDSNGYFLEPLNIKSMVGFDDIRGSNPETTPPISIEHQNLVKQLVETERGRELFAEERKLVESGGIPDFGRPDQFGFTNDYPYARELGFNDRDIRYYIEGFYSKILGKRIGPLMKLKLEDPNFGPLPKRLSGKGGAGVFDCENDYPYALSLGFNDRDIRFYLENFYRGQIDECMRRKLDDPNFGRVNYYVELTAPGCPPDQQGGDYGVITEIDSVYIDDGGFGFQPGDTATVLDCSGNPDSSAKLELVLNQDGTIVNVRVINPGRNYNCLPEIILNTDTGYNARLIPILRFRREQEISPGTQVLQVIDCVGKV